MIIERFAYSPMGTFGRLTIGDFQCFTVERPWLDNQASVSCVPEGDYILEPHSTDQYPDTYALVGETVSHYPEVRKARSAILFHSGNTMADLKGCIAPGLRLGWVADRWAVLDSRAAMKQLRWALQDVSKVLTIRHYEP